MALVRELQCSMSNTDSRTDEATSAGPVITFFCFSFTTFSSDSEETSYRHTSDSSQRSSPLRNKGPWSHRPDWTSSNAERPRVRRPAGLSLPAAWCPLEGAVRDWICHTISHKGLPLTRIILDPSPVLQRSWIKILASKANGVTNPNGSNRQAIQLKTTLFCHTGHLEPPHH